ncbi:MAG: hypothetical protein AUK55_15590 [Syntrophobacteraceae bacterium CG2_30_61_12]|nr:MAG: hypothetical protein AUK55_15590 [Syntrophobacteraceae bacterium CG2_30_61_12]
MHTYEQPDNLVAMIEDSIARYPDNPLFGTKDATGVYRWLSYRQVGERIDHLRAGLRQLGVAAGDAVGVICGNRTEWALAAFATFGLGARFIPMYEKELVQTWKYIINDGAIKVLLVATEEIAGRIEAFRHETPALEHLLVIDSNNAAGMSALEQRGAEQSVASIRPAPSDIAVLIYTSGTTGKPKGVLLSHGNFTSNFLAGRRCLPQLSQHSRSLSILPWAHSFGQTGELYVFTSLGGSIGFMENITTLVEDIVQVQPTVLVAVPRVFNKIHDGILAKVEEVGGLTRKLFHLALGWAAEKRRRQQLGRLDVFTAAKARLADRLVFAKIRERFGGRLEFGVSGSATMNAAITHFFTDLGIPVYDCYGLTETSPAVTMNGPLANRVGSVGRPIEQVRVVIDRSLSGTDSDEGEIVVHGPNVMQGYHNNPQATREVLTPDGGLGTGDQGRLDADGFLFITGRIKEQYKLENGKYVFPAALEEAIKLLPWVENVMIHGEGRPFNICLLVPDFPALERAGLVSQGTSPGPLSAPVRERIAVAVIEHLKGNFGGHEIPRKFLVLEQPFALDNGTLTQTLKLKRKAVLQMFGGAIEALYSGPEITLPATGESSRY